MFSVAKNMAILYQAAEMTRFLVLFENSLKRYPLLAGFLLGRNVGNDVFVFAMGSSQAVVIFVTKGMPSQ